MNSAIDYGFTSTEEVKFDAQGLPVGEYHVMAISEEVSDKISETNPNPIIVEYKILDGEFEGQTKKYWYNVHNINDQTANISRQNIKRLAEASGRAVTPSSPIKGRVFKVIVAEQKNDNTRTEIKKYLPSTLDTSAAQTAVPKVEKAPF